MQVAVAWAVSIYWWPPALVLLPVEQGKTFLPQKHLRITLRGRHTAYPPGQTHPIHPQHHQSIFVYDHFQVKWRYLFNFRLTLVKANTTAVICQRCRCIKPVGKQHVHRNIFPARFNGLRPSMGIMVNPAGMFHLASVADLPLCRSNNSGVWPAHCTLWYIHLCRGRGLQ